MSQENVEIVRRIVRAFDERDTATAVEPLDPRIELDATRSPAEDVLSDERRAGVDRRAAINRAYSRSPVASM